ncbi:hypothetical protein ACN082_09940 [Rothia sp. CCM 9417]|uniref:hypothetical protein n=1 Tax=Rothia sp. CCM 9417 TaxID=3402657 RepID=UPI003AEAC1EE
MRDLSMRAQVAGAGRIDMRSTRATMLRPKVARASGKSTAELSRELAVYLAKREARARK